MIGLIEIKQGIVEILNDYLYRYNDKNTRSEISARVSKYIGGHLDNEYGVRMDESNNPPNIIDENACILDVGFKQYDDTWELCRFKIEPGGKITWY